MYVGRFVVVAPGVGAYRVSSRSFPNRRVTDRDGTLTVGSRPDAPETDNPYVSYNCARSVETPAGESLAVVGNGSHVDPVAEKLEVGYPARDALAAPLLALDFEKDDYDTPRIAGVVGAETATIGVVRRDGLVVEAVDEPTIVATYETDSPEPYAFAAADVETPNPEVAAMEVLGADFAHPVCAAGATGDGAGVALAFANDPA